jgi:hypothetical protein
MDRSSLPRLQPSAAFRTIVGSVWVFLWIRTLLSVGAALEFIFMIFEPVYEIPIPDRSRMVTSLPGTSLGQMIISSAAGRPK